MNAEFISWVKSEEFKGFYKALPDELRAAVRHQIPRCGSGGSGNHFCEIQKDSEGIIWIMLHFGSRNLGQRIGNYYDNIAKQLNKKWYSSVPESYQLAFLPINTKEGKEYFNAMLLCMNYAKFNHKVVAEKIEKIVQEKLGGSFIERFFIHHNYARFENHFGKNVIVHRKGATSAREGEIGIVPGSQGSKSYIVRGLGNPKSFMSCSHGAGRKMGRNQAKKTLNLEEEIKKLDDQGIVHGVRNQKDLEEAVSAYKDISVVMEAQKDLVEILVELSPMGSIKG